MVYSQNPMQGIVVLIYNILNGINVWESFSYRMWPIDVAICRLLEACIHLLWYKMSAILEVTLFSLYTSRLNKVGYVAKYFGAHCFILFFEIIKKVFPYGKYLEDCFQFCAWIPFNTSL